MTVKRIDKIEKFGIFSDYKSSENKPKEFGKHNIIFGWNYSGKTTLSRIFSSLEQGKLHDDYQDGKFTIVLEKDHTIKETDVKSHPLKIRVFNTDYVRDNLLWEQKYREISPILVLGEKNIELEKTLEKLTTEKDDNTQKLSTAQGKHDDVKGALDVALTEQARTMTDKLSLGRNFTRTQLRSLLDDPNIANWELSSDERKKAEHYLGATMPEEPLSRLNLPLDTNILSDTRDILQKVVTPSQSIERLKDNPDLENWVRKGRELHADQTKCQFCQSDLPPDFLEQLDAHFSKEYESFRNEVLEHKRKLEGAKLPQEFGSKDGIYSGLQKQYVEIRNNLKETIKTYNEAIDQLVGYTSRKLENLSKSMDMDPSDCDSVLNVMGKMEELVKAINELFEEHNKIRNEFETMKEDSIDRLKKHYAAEFYNSQQYEAEKTEIKDMKECIKQLGEHIKELEKKREELKKQLSDTIKGAETLNHYLEHYFGPDTPIEIKTKQVDGQDKFQILRHGKEATNLSEGEKTAIAFAYFLTSLEGKDMKEHLKDTIVFVDDPVSSLDNNHIYCTFALICATLKSRCKQLFVSTHNFEFFRLLKGKFEPHDTTKKCNFGKTGKGNCKTNLFQIERNADNARLKDLDCVLCKFDSEYQYLFYHLAKFDQDQSDIDDYKLYTTPNILRRFLETYIGLRYPSCKPRLKDGLEKMIPGEEARKERILVQKVADEWSHGENISRTIQLPPTHEVKRAIEIVFNALDEDYLADLKASVGM